MTKQTYPVAKQVKCDKCGYIWNTLSKMILVSCPSCLGKVRINEIKK